MNAAKLAAALRLIADALEESPEVPEPAGSEKRITVDEVTARAARKLLGSKGIRTK